VTLSLRGTIYSQPTQPTSTIFFCYCDFFWFSSFFVLLITHFETLIRDCAGVDNSRSRRGGLNRLNHFNQLNSTNSTISTNLTNSTNSTSSTDSINSINSTTSTNSTNSTNSKPTRPTQLNQLNSNQPTQPTQPTRPTRPTYDIPLDTIFFCGLRLCLHSLRLIRFWGPSSCVGRRSAEGDCVGLAGGNGCD